MRFRSGLLLALFLGPTLLFTALTLAEAQQVGKVYRLGFLGGFPPTTPDGLVGARNLNGLIEGLRELGYVEGQNLIIERRYAEGRPERWPELASELVGLKVDVIVVVTTPAALAAKRASDTIPIVAPTSIDPVAAGLATSLARPGGNVTGITQLGPDLSAKGLALLKEAVPRLSKVAVLWNAGNPANAAVWKATEEAARALDLRLHPQEVGVAQDFERAFAAMAQDRPGGLLVLNDAVTFRHRRQIADFAIQKRLASVSQLSEYAEVGVLMSYGPNRVQSYRRAASYVDKILKGAKPADLPFEQPTKFELVLNLKTAKALNLTIPPSLLLRADQVIE